MILSAEQYVIVDYTNDQDPLKDGEIVIFGDYKTAKEAAGDRPVVYLDIADHGGVLSLSYTRHVDEILSSDLILPGEDDVTQEIVALQIRCFVKTVLMNRK